METTITGSVARPLPAADRARIGRAAGFTLLELLITMAIATILLTIAIPSFQYVTNSNRIAGEVNGLLGDLQYARSEAIKEGQYVSVCASSDGQTCSASPDWQGGWIVFVNPANNPTVTPGVSVLPILRFQAAFSSKDTFVSNGISIVTFNRNGYAGGMATGTIITLHDSTSNSAWTRCASIAPSGEVITEQVNVTNNGATCT
jgi:type IV fimbrial biogenesis protein FimT